MKSSTLLAIPPFYQPTNIFEISILLFTHCNLNCSFCFEKHDKYDVDFDVDTIVNTIVKKFASYIKNLCIPDVVNFKLWGGELFVDTYNDEVFEKYKSLILLLDGRMHEMFPSIKCDFNFVSNGVFRKYSRVKALLSQVNAKMSLSYDPVGRFPSLTAETLMLDNMKFFNDAGYLSCIAITLTKQSIYEYLNNPKKILQFKEFPIDLNYYVANTNYKLLLPSSADIFKMLKFLYDNGFYLISVIHSAIQTANGIAQKHHCDCKYSLQYQNGKCITDCSMRCSMLSSKCFYGDAEHDENTCHDIKAAIGTLKMHCLECEYNSICLKPCWISVIFEEFKVDSKNSCYLHMLHKHIQNGK